MLVPLLALALSLSLATPATENAAPGEDPEAPSEDAAADDPGTAGESVGNDALEADDDPHLIAPGPVLDDEPAPIEAGGDDRYLTAPKGVGPSEDPEEVAKRKRPPGRRLMIIGWSALAGGYVLGAVTGGALLDKGQPVRARWSFVPLFGPFVASAIREPGTDILTPRYYYEFSLLASAAQVAGLTMGIIGTLKFKRAKTHKASARRGAASRIASAVNLGGGPRPGGGLVTLVGAF